MDFFINLFFYTPYGWAWLMAAYLGCGLLWCAFYHDLAGGPCNPFGQTAEERETFWLILLTALVSWFFVAVSIIERLYRAARVWYYYERPEKMRARLEQIQRRRRPSYLPTETFRRAGAM